LESHFDALELLIYNSDNKYYVQLMKIFKLS